MANVRMRAAHVKPGVLFAALSDLELAPAAAGNTAPPSYAILLQSGICGIGTK